MLHEDADSSSLVNLIPLSDIRMLGILKFEMKWNITCMLRKCM